MAGVTKREFWDFRVKTRAQFTKLAEQIANIDTSGGGGISELTSKMVVDALGYTPYNAANPANYITSAALSPYLKTEDAEETYATKDFVNNKLTNYATISSVTAIQNTLTGQIGAVNASVEQLAATKLDSSYFTLANIKSTLGISDWALAATKPSYTASEVGALAVGGTAVNSDKLNGLSKSDFVRSYGDVGANYSKGNWVGYSYGTEAHGGSTVGGVISAGNEGWGFQLNGGAFNDGVYYRAYSDGTFNTWRKLAFTNSNVASATKLQTPRTLWGQSFDGTGNVDGMLSLKYSNMYAGIEITRDGGSSNEASIAFNSSAGRGVVGIWGETLNMYFNSVTRLAIKSNGNVGIGTTSPTERLDVSGNVKASGNINATSVTIGGVTLSWDSVNNALVVNGNMYGTGSITAKKVG